MSISMNMNVSGYGKNYTNSKQALPKNPNAIQYFANTLQNAIQDSPDAPETKRLEAIYDKLSEHSKIILTKMKNHQSISKEDWNALGQDLLANGAITQEEYDFTLSNVRLIPISFQGWRIDRDENGRIIGAGHSFDVRNDEQFFMPERLMARFNGDDPDNWQGDPFSFLDEWIENLQKMRIEGDDDYNLNYRTADIDAQISASKTVKGLLNDLLAMI